MEKNTNHQELRVIILQKKLFFDGVPLKGYVASYVIFRFGARNNKSIVGISND